MSNLADDASLPLGGISCTHTHTHTHTHKHTHKSRAHTRTHKSHAHKSHTRAHTRVRTHMYTPVTGKKTRASASQHPEKRQPRGTRHGGTRRAETPGRQAPQRRHQRAASLEQSPRGLHEKTSAHHHAFKKQDWDSDERSGHWQQRGGTFENLSPVSVFSTATKSVGLCASPSACPLATQMRCVFRSTVSSTGFGAKALAAPAGAEGTPSLCPLIITCKKDGKGEQLRFIVHRTSTPARQGGWGGRECFFFPSLGEQTSLVEHDPSGFWDHKREFLH
jgi:hypothetical protein